MESNSKPNCIITITSITWHKREAWEREKAREKESERPRETERGRERPRETERDWEREIKKEQQRAGEGQANFFLLQQKTVCMSPLAGPDYKGVYWLFCHCNGHLCLPQKRLTFLVFSFTFPHWLRHFRVFVIPVALIGTASPLPPCSSHVISCWLSSTLWGSSSHHC